MNYAQIRKFDVTNGPGVRATLFVSGCTHNCPGCFNREQQDFNYGNKWTKEVEDSFIEACKNPQIVGVSILGGEPMQQDYNTMKNLFSRIKEETNKPIWVWSGYNFGQLLMTEHTKDLLNYIDVLIDGKFIQAKRDLMLKYRGSSNQNVINVQESLKQEKVVLLNI